MVPRMVVGSCSKAVGVLTVGPAKNAQLSSVVTACVTPARTVLMYCTMAIVAIEWSDQLTMVSLPTLTATTMLLKSLASLMPRTTSALLPAAS